MVFLRHLLASCKKVPWPPPPLISTNLNDDVSPHLVDDFSTNLVDDVLPHLDLKRGKDASGFPGHQWLGGGCTLKPGLTHVVIVVNVIMFINIIDIIIKIIVMVTFAADYELSWPD